MYTRCPECHTTFRIGAADLQKAGGRVRCGRCGTAFDALASLGETPASPAAGPLSAPTAARFEQRYGDDGPTLEDTASRWQVMERPDSSELDDWEEDAETSLDDVWAAGLARPPGPVAELDPPEPATPTAPRGGDSERSLQEQLSLEASNLMDSGAWRAQQATWQAPLTPAKPPVPEEEPPVPEEEPPVPEEEPPAQVAALERTAAPSGPRRLAHWAGGSLALALALALLAQFVHQHRDALAVHPVTADWTATLYAALGQPLYPAWPLEDYVLQARDDAELTVDRELEIIASLSNRGSRPLPAPLIRLTLLDRWGAAMGSRLFAPEDYLRDRAPVRIAPGQSLQATLAVRAPDGELYGYRLDICRPLDADTLRCDAQAR